MPRIKVLDEQLANQIAAGEVVERPASVVKELVENAIDAGATTIDVTIEEGGLTLIRVVDNGGGINPEDIATAFQRHATSKIASGSDLFRIASLGFRGEALPSIAAVSRLTCVSADSDNGLARRLVIEGGTTVAEEPANAPQGTDMTVRDLFYNTPARLKYMKSIQTELGHISDYMNRVALAHPGIAVTLKHNGSALLQTLGTGDRLQVIAAVYGTSTAKAMLPLSASDPDYELNGYVSKPELTRANRNGITVVVNGRYIRSFAVNAALLQAYHTLLPINRFPLAVLEIGMHPSLLDVNVHPSKMEVRFSKEAELKALIEQAVKETLGKQRHIPGPGAGGRRERTGPLYVQDSISFHIADRGSAQTERLDLGKPQYGKAADGQPESRGAAGGTPAGEWPPGTAPESCGAASGASAGGWPPSRAPESRGAASGTPAGGWPPGRAPESRREAGSSPGSGRAAVEGGGGSSSGYAAPSAKGDYVPKDAAERLYAPPRGEEAAAPEGAAWSLRERGTGLPPAEEVHTITEAEYAASGSGAAAAGDGGSHAAGEPAEQPSAAASAVRAASEAAAASSADAAYSAEVRDATAAPSLEGSDATAVPSLEGAGATAASSAAGAPEASPVFPELHWIGQHHGTYIVAQAEDGLYLIDQHAAHERINYEYYLHKFGNPVAASQSLLVPITLEFTPGEAAQLRELTGLLQEAGVEIEPFGAQTFLVRAYPEWMPEGEERAVLEEMAELVIHERKSIDIAKLREKAAIMCACKASIKANDRMTREEGDALLSRLARCVQPYTCPHGRPIIVHLSTYQLEKMFKRVMS